MQILPIRAIVFSDIALENINSGHLPLDGAGRAFLQFFPSILRPLFGAQFSHFFHKLLFS